MNPLRRLEADHRAAERLFDGIQSADTGPARRAAYDALKDALEKHAAVEERIFYSAIRACGDVAAQELASLALDEHEDVRLLLVELDAIDPSTDAFAARCEMLAAEVARHVAMEEEDLFPRAARLLGAERLAAVGERIEAASRAAPPPATETRVRRPA